MRWRPHPRPPHARRCPSSSVRALRWSPAKERHDPQRQPRRLCLRFQHRPPRAVHRYTIELGVERGQQADNVAIAPLAQKVECPRAVLAAAPRYENPLHAGVMITADAKAEQVRDLPYAGFRRTRQRAIKSMPICAIGGRMNREHFVKVVAEVLDSLPEEFRSRIRNVAVCGSLPHITVVPMLTNR